jgi:hypothetical protein
MGTALMTIDELRVFVAGLVDHRVAVLEERVKRPRRLAPYARHIGFRYKATWPAGLGASPRRRNCPRYHL